MSIQAWEPVMIWEGSRKRLGWRGEYSSFLRADPPPHPPRDSPQTQSHRRSAGLLSHLLEAWGEDTISVTLCVVRLTVGLVLKLVSPPGKHPCSLRRYWCSQESAAAGNALVMPTQCKGCKNVGFIFSPFLFTQNSIIARTKKWRARKKPNNSLSPPAALVEPREFRH